MLLLRSIVFQVAFHANVLFWMILWLPTLPLHRRFALELGRQWGRTSLWLLEHICGVGVEIRGRENIPKGACIVACKHQSTWETFVLPIVFPDFSYILKRELMYIPFFGWYLWSAEQIAINRSEGGKLLPQLVSKAKALFAQRRQLFIFPEGTRRPAGAPPQYKFGVAMIYKDAEVPVVPAAVNAGLFWPRRSIRVNPGVAVIEFLPPIAPGLKSRDFFDALVAQMEAASDRLIDEALAKDPTLAPMVEANRRPTQA